MNTTLKSQTIPGTKKADHDQAGAPKAPGTCKNTAASPTTFAEQISKRADHPLVTTPAYLAAIRACEAAHKAQKQPYPASLSWSWASLDARLAALLLVLLIIIGTTLVGCRTVQALQTSPLADRPIAIERHLAE